MGILKTGIALTLTILSLAICCAGEAADTQRDEESKAYSDLIRMKRSMTGRWVGDAKYYDHKAQEFKESKIERNISRGPLPYTFHIEGMNEWEDGTTSAGYEVMGVRSDGALIRQILFQGGQTTFKEEIVLDYSIKSDDEWTLTMLEYREGQKGGDGPGVLRIVFEFSGDTWITTRSLAHDDAPGRDWESRAELYRQEENGGSK